jgi:tRNA (guanine-N7-)-methyltransferase
LAVIELIPESYIAPLELPKVFGRAAPLHVDLGCGDGSFLIAVAQRYPEKNFLGVERMSGRVEKACRKAAKMQNVRLLHLESAYFVERLLAPKTVETFYLLFPDPWPKRRHQRRRVVTLTFLRATHAALQENGTLQIATDQLDYFSQIQRLTFRLHGFSPMEANADLPPSTFETRFRQRGVDIYRLALRKVSPVT